MLLSLVLVLLIVTLVNAYNIIRIPNKIHKIPSGISNSKLQAWSPGVVIKPPVKQIEYKALANYVAATSVQWSLIVGFIHVLQLSLLDNLSKFKAISIITNAVSIINPDTISTFIVTAFMLFMSVRSRIFSPLNNSRPKANENDPVFKSRKRPSWQPAPMAFPIIWSTIALLRTISSVLIYKETESLLSLPILSMMAHLSIGDTWNTINNVEQRLGTSFLGVWFVWGSVIATVYRYYQTLPIAGKILLPSAMWLTIAVCLVYSIWRLNYESFNYPALLPTTDESFVSPWQVPFVKWFRSS